MKTGGKWLLYGASGYTGKLITREAIKAGMRPILAGRNRDSVRALASIWGLEWREISLSDRCLADKLEGVSAVLHCAGPFSRTSAPMVQACLKSGTHYLDITGEIDVFETILAQDAAAKSASTVLLPGVGFDVVPSDCLAKELSQRMQQATSLELAFAGRGGVSPGTLKTVVEALPKGGKVRRNGKIVTVRPGSVRKRIRLGESERWVTAIPWGDVSTAFHSTGIPNITVYAPMPRPVAATAQLMSRAFGSVLRRPRVQHFLLEQINRRVKGPSEDDLQLGKMALWGEVTSPDGKSLSGTLDLPEGYLFTALASLASLRRVLAGDVSPGAWTPSTAFGSRFVTEIPGTKMQIQ